MKLSNLSHLISAPLLKMGDLVVMHLPMLLGSAVILLAGWLIARTLRMLVSAEA